MTRFLRSLWARLILLSLVLGTVPVLIYLLLQDADSERRGILRRTVAEQGRLVAAGLASELDPAALPELNLALARFAGGGSDIRILYRPAEQQEGFFFVGAWPSISENTFEEEKERLLATGVLERLGSDCSGTTQTGAVYETVAGSRRAIASVTPVQRQSGCWVVITTKSEITRLGSTADQPYWQTPEMLISAVIYLVMVAAIFGLFFGIRANLQRFADLARLTGRGGGHRSTFREQNTVPELDGVAADFDLMVSNLRRSADQLRASAGENAHALKTPVGVIAQSLEPIRRALRADSPNGARAVELIERSIERLDGLISSIRRSEEAAADLVAPLRVPVDVAELAAEIADDFRHMAEERAISLKVDGETSAMGVGNIDLLTVAIENPIENAIGLIQPGGWVEITTEHVDDDTIEIRIADNGPGVAHDRLDEIFNRHVSTRSGDGNGHDGLGLWLTRRNMEALGGVASAKTNDQGGLTVVLRLPAA